MDETVRCPECGSSRLWKDGTRPTRGGDLQRFLCRGCGFRFSQSTANSQVKLHVPGQVLEQPNPGKNLLQSDILQREVSVKPSLEDPSFKGSKHVAPHNQTIIGKSIKAFSDYHSERRVGASEGGAKNLVEVESRTEKRAAGATKQAEVRGKIIEYLWHLKKQGYPESTISGKVKLLKRLVKLGANLWDPEHVKKIIATQETWGSGYKANVVHAYSNFAEMEGLTWTPPKYKKSDKVPFVPLESELDQLINGCGKTVSIFLEGLKETGADPGELWRVKWIDINKQSKTLAINHPVKGHNARILPISRDWMARLELLPKRSERVFPMVQHALYSNFRDQRKRLAQDFNNPRLLKITFTSFRHWKATMEYHKTHDPYHVKKLLGHKCISSTDVYINIEQALFTEQNDEFHFAVAKTIEEAGKLIEVGFEYVCHHEGAALFRKRK